MIERPLPLLPSGRLLRLRLSLACQTMRIDSRTRLSVLAIFSACVIVTLAHAESDDTSFKPSPQVVDGRSLQSIIKTKRGRGPLFVEIPGAYVFGMGTPGSVNYCSPSVRASNSSNSVVEELVIGIDYSKAGVATGSTISRFRSIKVQQASTRFYYQLPVTDCLGLKGQASILRCVYTDGEDCTKDVQIIGYGLIPLQPQSK